MAFNSARDQNFFELLKNCTNASDEGDLNLEELRQSLQKVQTLVNITHPETGNTLLHEAVVINNVLLVKTILSHSDSDEYLIQHPNTKGRTPLQMAASKQRSTFPEIVTLLKSTIVEKRAKEFVLQFFEHYSRKYDLILKRVIGEPMSINAQSVQGHTTNAIGIGSRAMGSFVTGSIINTFIDLVTFRRRRRRANSLWTAHHKYHKDQKDSTIPEPLAQLLLQDGFEIFAALEEHLVQFSLEDFQDWRNRRPWKLAIECVRRMMNYIANHNQDNMARQGHFSKCFVEGRLQGLQRLRPGKLAVVDKAGVVMVEKDDETGEEQWKYFQRSTGSRDTFQFRKACEFERREDDFLEKFEEISSKTEYKFLLTKDMIDKAVRELLVTLGYVKEATANNPGSSGTCVVDGAFLSDSGDPVDAKHNVLLAGDENIEKIVGDWVDSTLSGTLVNNWPKLAYKVGLAPQAVSELRKQLMTTQMDVYKLTVLILRHWVMQAEGEPGPTVGLLVDKLEELGWTEYARLVKIRFGIPE